MQIKRKRGQKIGPCKEWKEQRQRCIQQHRKRIVEEMRRIRRAGLDLHNTPVGDLLAAGVVLSNELYLTSTALKRLAEKDGVGTAHPTGKRQ